MLYVFCVVLCVGFCTGNFVMVPLNLNIYIVYNILSLSTSSIYIIETDIWLNKSSVS